MCLLSMIILRGTSKVPPRMQQYILTRIARSLSSPSITHSRLFFSTPHLPLPPILFHTPLTTHLFFFTPRLPLTYSSSHPTYHSSVLLHTPLTTHLFFFTPHLPLTYSSSHPTYHSPIFLHTPLTTHLFFFTPHLPLIYLPHNVKSIRPSYAGLPGVFFYIVHSVTPYLDLSKIAYSHEGIQLS